MALVLGGFIFRDYAIPERVPLGGEQQFVVHKLIGGGRVIDAMGRDDDDIRWHGRFQGPNAVQNAMQLDNLRISGRQVPLIIDSQYRQVGVKHFRWEYERWYQIVYSICCVVVQSSGSNGGSGGGASLDSLVSGDMNEASSMVQ
jgi:hypothetical protein